MMAAGCDLISIPVLVYRRTAANRRNVVEFSFVAGVELLLLGRIVTVADQWDARRLWWSDGPLLLVAALLLAYAAWSFRRSG